MLKEILQQVRRLEVSSKNKITSLFAGNYRSTFKGRGIEFADIRPYDPGDDVRDIDWKTTSKQGELFVKTYHESRDNTLFFVLDGTASMFFSSTKTKKYETLLKTFALLAFSAVTNGDRVGAILYGIGEEKIFPPKKGRKNVLKILKYCIEYYQNSENFRFKKINKNKNDISFIFRKILLLLKHSTNIFWLQGNCLELTKETKKQIKMLNFRHDFIPFVFTDPYEKDFSHTGQISLRDSFSGKFSNVFIDKKVQQKFQKIRQIKKLKFQKFLKKNKITPLFFNHNTKIFQKLFIFFQKR